MMSYKVLWRNIHSLEMKILNWKKSSKS